MAVQRHKIGWVLWLPVALVLAGCPFSPDKKGGGTETPEPSDYKPQTSIDNVLYNLRQAYIDMNYDEYEKLLDAAYVFVFDPDDVGPETNFEDELLRGDDLASTKNMFTRQPNVNGQIVEEIRLTFDTGDPETSPENAEWQRVILTAVDLALTTIDQNGDTWILQTPGNYEAYLHFVQTSETDADSGLPIWKIVRWEDKPPVLKTLIAAN